MLEKGATTWWEAWELPNKYWSKCHSYYGTPAYDLSTHVLGVYPTTPGFARFRVEPHPADLTWCSGVFPSARGDIAVSWKLIENGFELTIGVPAGTEAEVIVPELDGKAAYAVQVDGIAMPKGAFAVKSGEHAIKASYD